MRPGPVANSKWIVGLILFAIAAAALGWAHSAWETHCLRQDTDVAFRAVEAHCEAMLARVRELERSRTGRTIWGNPGPGPKNRTGLHSVPPIDGGSDHV